MKKTGRRLILILAILTSVVFVTPQLGLVQSCFAEDEMYTISMRDGAYIRIPEGWQVEEIGSLQEDIDSVDAGEQILQIAEIQDENGDSQGQLWAYVETDPYADYYYCDTKEEAQEYYEDAGSDALNEILSYSFENTLTEMDKVSYIKGEDNYTFIVRQEAECDDKDYLTYVSCEYTSEGAVHLALLFEEPENSKICDRIGESMEGYSYAQSMTIDGEYSEDTGTDTSTDWGSDSGYDESYDEDSFDTSSFFTLLLNVLVWCLIIWFVIRRIRKKKEASGTAAIRRPEKRTDKWVFKQFKTKNSDHPVHDDCQATQGGRYSGYRESLKTLHKSGLLTTREMNELLEKHKNDII